MTQYLVNKMPALDWGEALPWVRECPHREPLWPVARMLDLLGAAGCWSCFTGLLHSSIRNYSILCFQHLGSLGRVQLFPLPHMPALPSPLPLPNSPSSHAATAEMRLGPLHPGAKLHKDSVSWLMRGAALTTEWHCFIASDYLQSLTKLIPMPLFINTVFFFSWTVFIYLFGCCCS